MFDYSCNTVWKFIAQLSLMLTSGTSVLYLLSTPDRQCVYNGSSFSAFSTVLLLNTVFFPLPLFSFHCLFLFPPLPLALMEAKRSQSISNCVHLYEALPTTKSVPMLLHTVSSFLPGISSGNSACSHRLSGKVYFWELHVFVCLWPLFHLYLHLTICHILPVSVSAVFTVFAAELYGLT